MNQKRLVLLLAAIGVSFSAAVATAQTASGAVDAQAYEWLKAPVASQPDPLPLSQALRQLSPPTLRVAYEESALAQVPVTWPQSATRAGALNAATRTAGLVATINADGSLSIKKGANYRPPVVAAPPVVMQPQPVAAPVPAMAPVAAGSTPNRLPPGVVPVTGAEAPPSVQGASALAQTLAASAAKATVTPAPVAAPAAETNNAPRRGVDPADIEKARAYLATHPSGQPDPVDESPVAKPAANSAVNPMLVSYLSAFVPQPNRIVQLDVSAGGSYAQAFAVLLAPNRVEWQAGKLRAKKPIMLMGPAKRVLPRLMRQIKRDSGVDLSLELGSSKRLVIVTRESVKDAQVEEKPVLRDEPKPSLRAPRPSPRAELPAPGSTGAADGGFDAVMTSRPTILLNKGQSIGNAWITAGIRQNVKVYWDAPDFVVTDSVRLDAPTVEELGRTLVQSLNRNGANLKMFVYENPQGGDSAYRIAPAN